MKTLPRSIDNAIKRFDEAAQALGVMKDGAQPDNWYTIVHRYEKARNDLDLAILKGYAAK